MRFKYISCSYLSSSSRHLFVSSVHSNTSHVLIYRPKTQFVRKKVNHSNTSHVLIYPCCAAYISSSTSFKYISCSYLSTTKPQIAISINIQIHLMFLFIVAALNYLPLRVRFKYISCSYLSVALCVLS